MRTEYTQDFVTRREAAEFLGVSYNTIIAWQQRGRLRVYVSAGRTGFSRKELIEFLRPKPVPIPQSLAG